VTARKKKANIVVLLSGPNLNLLGQREPQIYGKETLDDHVATCRAEAEKHGLTLEHLQSNHEGELIDAIQGARGRAAAIIINAGALSHYSWAIHDALVTFEGAKVELHLSNPFAREEWRHTSVIAPVVNGSITGFKGSGYRLAALAVAELLGVAKP
jgi:3-dehydroquinate dehydratase II